MAGLGLAVAEIWAFENFQRLVRRKSSVQGSQIVGPPGGNEGPRISY